ncbi:hypothetical protein LBW62_13495 [Ralstonia solanacearum]|uniref:hypothetical protein n=1 Tax=Ralstonia solanacearum TaxID=305 RepID=UPI0005C6A960|nr:hypothetical protein [Ralstonia solanacearum]MDB0542241.1 hypothetical protein [Ralstonia solanacearum]MDB0552487.1 hypothetical protein [Ralstonia solanacearum]MDB0557205.1 hypothetical protein [Ralstonia solanacearum]
MPSITARLGGVLVLVLAGSAPGMAQSPTPTRSDLLAASAASASVTHLAAGVPLASALPRYGINLGGTTTWGAEQLLANVLKNPGLEGGLDRSLLVAGRIGRDTVSDDAPWAARPAGFWAGARFTVRSGHHHGAQGVVVSDATDQVGQAGSLALLPWPQALARGDVIALSRDSNGPIPLWWTEGAVQAAPGQPRPGSPGSQSARLTALGSPATLRHYLDMLGARAGKLLPLAGRWRLSFWVRSTLGQPRLAVHLGRDGALPLVAATLAPEAGWQHHEIVFEAGDSGPPGPITLSFEASGGELLLDDIALEESDAGPGGFRRTVVDTLKALRPGYVRDWQGQLGDSAANRFAPPFARRPWRYRAGEAEWMHGYSVDELFALCAALDARPWVVLPTTLDDDEALVFGRRLGELARRYRIDETVVEFGNENWNAVFRPAGIMNGATLAQVADTIFARVRQGAGAAALHFVVGGQYANPDAALALARTSSLTNGLAVAPYLLQRMTRSQDAQAALDAALREDTAPLARLAAGTRAAGKSLDVYEVNFHTTLGDAPASARTALLERAGAGTALARRLMLSTLAGSRRQAVYALAGFDTRLDQPDGGRGSAGGSAWLPLWGIVRDLGGANRWRPTGLSLQMLNEVAADGVHALDCAGPGCAELVGLAWPDGALAVTSSAPQALVLSLPCSGPLLARQLDDTQPWSGQPPRVQRLPCTGNRTAATLAARSLLTVRPEPMPMPARP